MLILQIHWPAVGGYHETFLCSFIMGTTSGSYSTGFTRCVCVRARGGTVFFVCLWYVSWPVCSADLSATLRLFAYSRESSHRAFFCTTHNFGYGCTDMYSFWAFMDVKQFLVRMIEHTRFVYLTPM